MPPKGTSRPAGQPAKRGPGRPRTRRATANAASPTLDSPTLDSPTTLPSAPATPARRGRPPKRPASGPSADSPELGTDRPAQRRRTIARQPIGPPAPGDASYQHALKYSITVAKRGGDVPTSWLDRTLDWAKQVQPCHLTLTFMTGALPMYAR